MRLIADALIRPPIFRGANESGGGSGLRDMSTLSAGDQGRATDQALRAKKSVRKPAAATPAASVRG